MSILRLGVYSGEALNTYKTIMKGMDGYTPNKLYHNIEADNYFYVNTKGYLHLYVASNKTVISDMMLTKENIFKETDYTLIIDNEKRSEFLKMLQDATDVEPKTERKEIKPLVDKEEKPSRKKRNVER